MRKLSLLAILLICGSAFAQKSSGISGTRIGGVRPGTVQRAQQKQDPEVKKEIAATSKETGISRDKLLGEFRDTQQKLAAKTSQQGNIHMTVATTAAGTTSAFSVQDFHKAKVFSVQNKVPMDTIVDRIAQFGDFDKALADLKTNPQ
jgi:hypothetical protein